MTGLVFRAPGDTDHDLVARAAVGVPDGRRVDVRLYSWGDVATSTHEGIQEQLLPGVFADSDPARVVLESQRHGGSIVGVGEELVERDDGIYGTFRVAETEAGDELLALIRPGPAGEPAVLRDASVVFLPKESRPAQGGIVQRVAAELRRVAILERGAYASAGVVAVRSEVPVKTCQHEGCEEQLEEAQYCAEHQPAPAAAPAAEPVERDDARLDAIEGQLRRVTALAAVPGAAEPHALGGFGSLGDYAADVYRGDADQDLLARALVERAAADQITGNNPGVLPPVWLQDVKRIVDLGRRAITAFGGPASLGASGMEVDWPYLNSSNTIIGAQSTQKTEVTTARVDIAKGSASLVTYAGYSDISYQLLQRSSPSYRDAYDRILLAAWGAVTDAAFCTALEGASGTTTMAARSLLGTDVTLQTSAASDDIVDATAHGLVAGDAIVFTALTGGTGLTAGRVYWVIADNLTADDFQFSEVPDGTAALWSADITAGTVAKVTDTGAKFRAKLAQASVSVEDATGQPAGIVLAGADMFLMLAGMTGFVGTEPTGNPSNAAGTMMASSLRMESSGLVIQRAPGVSYGKTVISNREVAAWHEDGPRFATSEDVAKLGQNVGVYSFAAPAVYAPAGVVELTLI